MDDTVAMTAEGSTLSCSVAVCVWGGGGGVVCRVLLLKEICPVIESATGLMFLLVLPDCYQHSYDKCFFSKPFSMTAYC